MTENEFETWDCPNCLGAVWVERDKCWYCHTPRPDAATGRRPMTETPDPAAVQIVAAVLGYETHSPPGQAQAVVAALARRWALVEHAELAALLAVADATFRMMTKVGGEYVEASRDARAALDALPVTGGRAGFGGGLAEATGRRRPQTTGGATGE